MKSFSQLLSLLLLISMIFLACSKDVDVPTPPIEEEKEIPITVDVNGFTEKGPYLSGSTVTINELNKNYAPTGRVFNTQIIRDDGSFELKGIELSSTYLSLSASGFYFNEVSNDNSEAQLTMHAISDVSDASSVNINTITTLEKNRVEYLLSEGSTFADAKSQALNEVLSLFEMSDNDFAAEDLTIGKAGDANAKLLAVSVILQGFLPIADLSELLSKISLDIREDGILDDLTLGEQLVYNAYRIDLADIRKNLETRFQNIDNSDAVVPAFEDHVLAFINNTRFEYKSSFEYPKEGSVGKNILHPSFVSTEKGMFSMAAVIPEGGQLRVKLTGNNILSPAGQASSGMERTAWNRSEYSAEYSSNRIGEVDFEIWFEDHDPEGPIHNKVKVEIFENDDEQATFTKEILLTDINLEIRYKTGLLDNPAGYFDIGDQNMGAFMGEGLTLKTIIRGDHWELDESQMNTGWEYSAINPADNSRVFSSISSYEEIDISINILQPPGDTIFDIFENLDDQGNLISRDTTIVDIYYDKPAATIEVFENGSTTPTTTHSIYVYPY